MGLPTLLLGVVVLAARLDAASMEAWLPFQAGSELVLDVALTNDDPGVIYDCVFRQRFETSEGP